MTESSALGRVTCQPSICPWLDCRARLRNKSALHYADTPSGRMIESPAHCSRPKISPQMSASVLESHKVQRTCVAWRDVRFSVPMFTARPHGPLLNFSLPNGPDVCCWDD
jgi:hypothetical protein